MQGIDRLTFFGPVRPHCPPRRGPSLFGRGTGRALDWAPARAGLLLLLVLVINQVPVSAQAATLRLAVLGDSISAGDGSDFGEKPNWVTQITKSGAFKLTSGGNHAVGGATSTDVLAEQLPDLLPQIAAGQVDYTVLMIGANDAGYAALDYLSSGDLNAAINGFVTTAVANIQATIDAISKAGAVHQIVANIPDQTVSPLVKSYFTQYHATPAQIEAVRTGVLSANSQIEAYALARGIPVLDMFSASGNIISKAPLKLAGVTFNSAALFSPDGYHPGPVAQGLLANGMIQAANLGYGAGLPLISDQQIVRNVGKIPLTVGPTYYNMAPYVILPVPEPAALQLALLAMISVGAWRMRGRSR